MFSDTEDSRIFGIIEQKSNLTGKKKQNRMQGALVRRICQCELAEEPNTEWLQCLSIGTTSYKIGIHSVAAAKNNEQ